MNTVTATTSSWTTTSEFHRGLAEFFENKNQLRGNRDLSVVSNMVCNEIKNNALVPPEAVCSCSTENFWSTDVAFECALPDNEGNARVDGTVKINPGLPITASVNANACVQNTDSENCVAMAADIDVGSRAIDATCEGATVAGISCNACSTCGSFLDITVNCENVDPNASIDECTDLQTYLIGG